MTLLYSNWLWIYLGCRSLCVHPPLTPTPLSCYLLYLSQGVAMMISTTTFGVYFYLIPKPPSTPSPLDLLTATGVEPHSDLTWLALASMAIFISGESHERIGPRSLQTEWFTGCCRVQVLPLAGVRSRGSSCRRSSPSEWGGSPAQLWSSATGAWRSSSPKLSRTWWWALVGKPHKDSDFFFNQYFFFFFFTFLVSVLFLLK